MTSNIVSLADRQSQAVRDRAAAAVRAYRATINGRLTLGHLLGEGPGPQGTIHVMPDDAGFVVSHESASGNSWGSNHGPFETVEAAISAAATLNITSYDCGCDVVVHGTPAAHQENL